MQGSMVWNVSIDNTPLRGLNVELNILYYFHNFEIQKAHTKIYAP